MFGGRDERVADLYFEDQTATGNPSEEGVARLVSDDLVAFLGGQVKSLTSGAPVPAQIGQILISIDGLSYENHLPVTTCDGWLVNDQGFMVVQ